MLTWLELFAAVLLFIVGLRLSAFFSGTETGFYRLSLPRLNIDARVGDKRAQQLLWFARHPAYFVATCLIGNNFANYATTAAISWLVVLLFTPTHDAIDIAATLLMSPIIFQFGELLPKNIYYAVPSARLRRDIRWFRYFFRIFFVISYPLVLITRLFEQLSGQHHHPVEMLLGRNRFVQLMQHGREEGLVNDLQSRLTSGILQLAPQSVTASMTPVSRILGMPDSASREELLQFARHYGIAGIVIHRAGRPADWYGYLMVCDLIGAGRPKSFIRPMPLIEARSSKLAALHQLQFAQATYGVVRSRGETLGIVARNGLIGQIFRPELSQRSLVNL